MKFIFPIKKKDNESTKLYISKCRMYLTIFKQILQGKIQNNKLVCRKEDLFNEPNIHWRIDKAEYNINLIINTFINQLQCYYDSYDNVCYYMLPNNIRCPYTTTNLNKVIRTLEYGGQNMPPLAWIRPSYQQFVNVIINKNDKNK